MDDLKLIKQKIKRTKYKKLKNNKLIVGIDEVGRGCLAGPVVSAAVVFKQGINLSLMKDSKKYPSKIEKKFQNI